MNNFNEKEFEVLCKRFNVEPHSDEITIEYSQSSFFKKLRCSIEADRRGEVVFCVIRKNGKIITITCESYPEGIFRIPTGGIGYGEDIVDAVYREVREELGLTVKIRDFAGVIKIRFKYQDEQVMFYSYLFVLDEIDGNLLIDAEDDEISEIRDVDIDELHKTAGKLGNIQGKWHDWGLFRCVTTKAVADHLAIYKERGHIL